MNLKTCQYFVALAEEMNFTKASESLHITQQSLSGSIKRLEEEYGVELFQRKPYLKLTPAGETMLFYSKQMLRNESQMMASLADLSAECSGHLVLGMSRQRIQVFFPGIWERYHNAYPNVSLDLRQSYTLKMADSLQAGKLDLFIGQTSGFFDGSIVAGESGEGGKLRRSIRHRHLRSRSGDVVREIDNLVVPIIHAHSVSHLLDKLEFSN